jgi:hypothetical protein
MVMKAKVRNEWVEAYVESGEIIDEVPKELVEEVIAIAERRKPAKEEVKDLFDDLSLR